ncbi:MAG: glucose-6-phosphate dehydrogenase [Candidatus Woesearchaeota archaeon]
MTKNVTLVLFGGTGDLTKRKLIPAFSKLHEADIISDKSIVVGVGRSEYTDETYAKLIHQSVTSKKERDCLKGITIKYFRTDSSKPDGLKGLAKKLKTWEQGKKSERIFYFATTYTIFPQIISNISQEKLQKNCKVVFEKPFGNSSQSAHTLQKHISTHFTEDQVYRIDHYLGKETVRNVNALRFTNTVIDAMLCAKHVKSISVIARENLSVKDRLGYYDSAGSVKDMIQSHLLQVVALLLMDRPSAKTAECFQDEKVKILQKIQVADASKHLLGQYKGYATELAKVGFIESRTDTYSNIEFRCDHPRWKGIPITIETGKEMNTKEGKIIIEFQQVTDELSKTGYTNVQPNRLVIDIHPEEDITIFFNTRKRYTDGELEQVGMSFCGNCHFGKNTNDGYVKLLKDVVNGDKTLCIRDDELAESWNITDKIESQRPHICFVQYEKGSTSEQINKLRTK